MMKRALWVVQIVKGEWALPELDEGEEFNFAYAGKNFQPGALSDLLEIECSIARYTGLLNDPGFVLVEDL